MRNRHLGFWIHVVFATMSALSLHAQSHEISARRQQLLQQKSSYPAPILVTARLEAPAMGEGRDAAELPDAPSASKSDTSSGEPAPSPVVKRESRGAAPAGMGGPFGVDGRVADRNYLVVTGAMFSASVANAELTLNCLKQHAACNDIPPSLHSRLALYGIGIPADLGVAYLTYFMKRRHSSIWFVPAAGVTAANLFFGVRAYRWAQD